MYKEIPIKWKSFLHEDEPEVIHILEIRENEYLVVHEDAYDELTGKTEFLSKIDIRAKYGIEL